MQKNQAVLLVVVEKKETLMHSWLAYKLVQPLWKTVWSFLKKTKNKIAIWSASGYFSKENENTDKKRYMHTCIHCTIFFLTLTKI